MLSIMLSQFNVCIDDLNPARREVNRIMWYCVCSQISTADGQFGKPARLRRNRLILTPKSGLVVGIRDLCASYNVHKNAVEEAGDGEESDEDLDGM